MHSQRPCPQRRAVAPVLSAVAALLAVAAAANAQAGWWNTNWRCRRLVTVEPHEPTRLPGADVAVVEMLTGGKCRPDGSDIRVTTTGRTEVPCRVLMVGPGDRAVIAFALYGGVRAYHVYFSSDAPGQPKPLELRRGVLQETWEYPGGGIKTLQQVRSIFDKVKTLVGRGFRERVFIGHNPFGPQDKLATRFTAWLNCPADGAYTFSCSSQDASFLLVDGKAIVENGGHHRPQRNIAKRGKANLTKGLHELTFYHVQAGGNPIAVAAWQAPGDKKVWPIPREAFAPVFRATPGEMEIYGKSYGVDFLAGHAGECFLANRYTQRWQFEALRVGSLGRSADLEWDFGDGQTAGSSKPEHVYLTPGEYTVTLSAKAYRGEIERVNRIFVSRPWDKVTENKLDSLQQHARIVAEYDFAKLGPEANAFAVVLLHRAKAVDPLRKAGAALLARDEVPHALLDEAVPLYAEDLPAEPRARAYLRAEQLTKNVAVRARMAERAARVLLEQLNQYDEAMAHFQRIGRQYATATTDRAIRAAKIGIGDVWRARGDYDKAHEAYRTAGYGESIRPARLEITKGDYARHLEDYLRRGQFPDAWTYADKWAADIPLDKLEGYWSLLVARLLTAEKRHADAAREARTLVAVNPRSQYAPKLLLLAAEAYAKLGKTDDARAALTQLAEKYPESPLASDAARKLK